MITSALTTASLWVAAPIWHLWRLAKVKPVYGTMANNQRAETTMLLLVFGAASMRYLVLGDQAITFGHAVSVLVGLLTWMLLVFVLVQGVLRAVVTFFPTDKEKRDFIDVATLSAWGCSAVIDLLATSASQLSPGIDQGLGAFVFLLAEVSLIVGNIIELRKQAKLNVSIRTSGHRSLSPEEVRRAELRRAIQRNKFKRPK